MKYYLVLSSLVASAFASPALLTRDVDVSLIPAFGVQAGVNPDGNGNCDGIDGPDGVPILIPCSCPPDRDAFVQEVNTNVNAGIVVNNPSLQVSFPTDDSIGSQLARLNTAFDTLQNFAGPGVGCPIESTDWTQLRVEISDGDVPTSTPSAPSSNPTSAPSAPPTSAPSAPPSSGPTVVPTTVASPSAASSAPSAAPTGGVDPALVPPFGVQAGVNPDGQGSCDGIDGPDGVPVLIPCTCPPDRDTFIADVSANVAAGFIISNPGLQISWPTDNSTASQLARLNTAFDTLQNLDGIGVGCPIQSTDWTALQAEIVAESEST
ncbi:hypothetical protein CERSUDRAFT_111963 [Gelatoporia subvermispora B]|uniref:Uncharacterized protein n=1 Tax=Ceriporiopsis subvermispora (strain B) TaxID=914234 RepID=M2QRE4_CERS8|nr:hypothetical protein CERSUDRAFT_111963 [Gelatoporia subvermispora B]